MTDRTKQLVSSLLPHANQQILNLLDKGNYKIIDTIIEIMEIEGHDESEYKGMLVQDWVIKYL